jgi:hypothetical protein
MEENPKAKYGHIRDRWTDCLQLVTALVITTDGFPLAYEVMNGNTSDRTTLRSFLDRIEKTCGKAKRTYVMDHGNPTEAILQEMRGPAREKVHESMGVKLFEQDSEQSVLAKTKGRRAKETTMRQSLPSLVQLLMCLGSAKPKASRALQFVHVQVQVPGERQEVTRETFQFRAVLEYCQRVQRRSRPARYHHRCGSYHELPAIHAIRGLAQLFEITVVKDRSS